MAPARLAAWRTLARVGAGATLADALVRERDGLADARDRRLATDLATGVLRWRSALDAAIAAASTRPLAQLDVEVLDILRLGAYQLRHRDRLPAHAVVSDAVAMARVASRSSAAGFVNAVLRKLAKVPAPPAPDPAAIDALDVASLAVLGAHPVWLTARWVARLGAAAAWEWMAFDNAPAPLTLRPGPGGRAPLLARLAAAGIEAAPARWARDAVIVAPGAALDVDTLRDAGATVQDEASQVVGEIAAGFPGTRRLDVCAAPGGKTLALRAAAHARVVAGEQRPRRVRLLRETLARAGAGTDVRIVRHDATGPLPYRPVFDVVLVDAPCSGLGTLRREPDLKWRREEADLAAMAAVQRRMLAQAARVVAPGGVLVYATCSSEPEENDAVADAFLATEPAFAAATLPAAAPAREGAAALVDDDGRLRTSPLAHGLEAFYAAAFVRRGA